MRVNILSIAALLTLASCNNAPTKPDIQVPQQPQIFPDYTNVTIPKNLVSPKFWIAEATGADRVCAKFTAGDKTCEVNSSDREISLSRKQWADLRHASDTVTVAITTRENGKWVEYAPFDIYIAPEPIDRFIAYRLIEPGYESWNEMGIYQRSLESYREAPIVTNRQTDYGCMNCHSFCSQDPDKMLMHMRVEHGGTYIIEDGEITKLNTKTPETISALVYPYWHPSGKYVVFSVNDTKQLFHTTDINRIEVFDYASDVVVYDMDKHEIVSTPMLKSETSFETFPSFSPDGKTLYFCSADSVSMPGRYDQLKYNICAIGFDPDTRTFGTAIDTLYNAKADNHSAAFPRVSPDGRWLMFTKSDYGTFPIWHHDADLYMIDLETKEIRALDTLNSEDTESYHSWSNNGRWVVYSSRRGDGLYTRPYIAYVDSHGNAHKPLILPPATEDYYDRLMKSYNIPEFITDHVKTSGYDISQAAKEMPGIDVRYVK